MKRVLMMIAIAACGGAKAKTAEVSNTSTSTATPTTAAAAADNHKPGSTSFPNLCCCVDGADSSMAWDGPSDCTKGTCTDQWTDECTSEGEDQEVADQRNQADAECASGDRHDCDGDGYRAGGDKDDDDPKVH